MACALVVGEEDLLAQAQSCVVFAQCRRGRGNSLGVAAGSTRSVGADSIGGSCVLWARDEGLVRG